jgi:predicted MFS family arabinose efflux permease
MLTGAGLLPLMHGANGELAMFAIVALGVGQSMSIPAWVAWDAATQEAQIPALLRTVRLLEWLGAAAGPLVAGALIAAYGLPHTALVLAVCALAASLLFLYANCIYRRRMGAHTP